MKLKMTTMMLAALAAAPWTAQAEGLERDFRDIRSQILNSREDARAWGVRPVDFRACSNPRLYTSRKYDAVEAYLGKKAEHDEAMRTLERMRRAPLDPRRGGVWAGVGVDVPPMDVGELKQREKVRTLQAEVAAARDAAVASGGLIRDGDRYKKNLGKEDRVVTCQRDWL